MSDFRSQLLSLSPKEAKELLAQMMGYREVPPTIDEFIESDYWLGGVLENGSAVYPYWRRALNRVFPNPFTSPYIEVIATGAIGIGKTTLAKIGASYDLAKLLLLENPQQTYRLLKTTAIEYLIVNATLNLAKSVIYDELLSWYSLSPFFASMVSRSDGKTLFPNKINLSQGSRASHALGRAIFGAILDEMNFQDKVANQAIENYTNILRRMQSRFGTGGKLPGHLWLLSSKRRDADPLQVHIENSRVNPYTLIFDAAIWEVKRESLNLSGKHILVYAGDPRRDPFVIGEEQQYKKEFHANLDEARIVKVPIEFRREFEMNLTEALRDLAGVSVQGAWQFFGSVEALERAMTMVNPVAKEVIQLDFYNSSDQIIRYFQDHMSRLTQPLSPKSPRFIHIDLALSKDKVGIASTFLFGWQEVVRHDPVSGKSITRKEPVTATDFVIWIQAASGQEIPLFKIKEFILDLSRLKYPIQLISTDGFQSALLRQELHLMGFPTELISVDRTQDPYLYLKTAILESRHILPKSELLKRELLQLIDDGSKIDHPAHGSKDGTDAVAGSLWAAIQSLSTGSHLWSDLASKPESYWDTLKWIPEVQENVLGDIPLLVPESLSLEDDSF